MHFNWSTNEFMNTERWTLFIYLIKSNAKLFCGIKRGGGGTSQHHLIYRFIWERFCVIARIPISMMSKLGKSDDDVCGSIFHYSLDFGIIIIKTRINYNQTINTSISIENYLFISSDDQYLFFLFFSVCSVVPPRIHHISSGGHMQVKKGASVRIECSASGKLVHFLFSFSFTGNFHGFRFIWPNWTLLFHQNYRKPQSQHHLDQKVWKSTKW